jgi:sugar lactone lactonase YvrE
MRQVVFLVAVAAVVAAGLAGGAVAGPPGGPNPPQPLTTFPKGSFPESLAVRDGDLYVSLGFAGQVVKVTPAGAQTVCGAVSTGEGLLTGLAFDDAGNLYVAAATFAADPAPGVFEIPAGCGTPTRVLTLPSSSFPNGLAFHGGYLYVSDSAVGAIWRVQPGGGTNPGLPWYQDPLLAPTKSIGANGIAFDATGKLYVVVADSGRVMRLTLNEEGYVSASSVVSEQEQLRSADGIAFDKDGNLYISVNDTNRLYRLTVPDGALTRLADRSDGLSYPTQPAFAAGSTTLYLTNGAFANGLPDIEAFDFDTTGLPLP